MTPPDYDHPGRFPPDTPQGAVVKFRAASLWRDMAAVAGKLSTMIRRQRDEPVRYYLGRLTALFSGMPPDRGRELPALGDYETPELVAELRRRMHDEHDRAAATALCARMPVRSRKRKIAP